jgi:diguanylate cyclase (GGDEF)-like protein
MSKLQQAEISVAEVLLEAEATEVVDDWRELCSWDPALPPGTRPLSAERVVGSVINALRQPQPLGWGIDDEVAWAVADLDDQAASVAVTVGELICLHEALARRLRERLPADEVEEFHSRLRMIIDRAIASAVGHGLERLGEEAYCDALTGLLNRRAFERDVRREVARAARHGRTCAVVLIDLDGLKVINDTHGHATGDRALCSLALALAMEIRAADSAYRIGGDEFALLLPDTPALEAVALVSRLAPRAPSFSWGTASCPAQGVNAARLVQAADRSLYGRRRAMRQSALLARAMAPVEA